MAAARSDQENGLLQGDEGSPSDPPPAGRFPIKVSLAVGLCVFAAGLAGAAIMGRPAARAPTEIKHHWDAIGLDEASVPNGYELISPGCVFGGNIIMHPGKSVESCAALCDAHADCVAFEFGVDYGGDGKYVPGDCQLQSYSGYENCDGTHYNLDLYVKSAQESKGSGFTLISSGFCDDLDSCGEVTEEQCMQRADQVGDTNPGNDAYESASDGGRPNMCYQYVKEDGTDNIVWNSREDPHEATEDRNKVCVGSCAYTSVREPKSCPSNYEYVADGDVPGHGMTAGYHGEVDVHTIEACAELCTLNTHSDGSATAAACGSFEWWFEHTPPRCLLNQQEDPTATHHTFSDRWTWCRKVD